MKKQKKQKQPRTSAPPPANNTTSSKMTGQGIPAEVLESLPEPAKTAVIEAASFQGPLPPPILYGEYDKILPGSAERIMLLTEREQAHRHKWESEVLGVQGGEIKRGQWLGFLLGAAAISGAIYCATINQPWVAGILVSATLVSIVTAFIKGRSKND